jgi:phosphoribosyl-dephospho-CoA transferase
MTDIQLHVKASHQPSISRRLTACLVCQGSGKICLYSSTHQTNTRAKPFMGKSRVFSACYPLK